MTGTEFERWLRAELAAKYVELMRAAADDLIGDVEDWRPSGIAAGALAVAERRYGLDVEAMTPWTCRGGTWKRW